MNPQGKEWQLDEKDVRSFLTVGQPEKEFTVVTTCE